MFCSNCGTKLDDDAKFCYNRGTQVASPTATPSVSETETVYPVQAPEQPAPVQTTQPDQTYIPQGTIFPTGYSPAEEAAKATATVETPAQVPQQPVAETPAYTPQPQVQAPYYDTTTAQAQPVAADPVYAAQPQVQVPQYAASPVQAAPKKKKGKTGLIIVAALLILALAAGGLYYFKSYRPKKMTQDYLNQALEAYDSGDYDTAVDLTEKAYKLSPDNEDIEQVLYSLYYELNNNAWNEGDYETSIFYLKKMATLPSTDQDSVDTILHSEYNLWLLDLALAGDTARGMEVLEEAKPYLTDEEYADRLAELSGDFSHWGGDTTEEDTGSEPEEPDDGEKPVVENVTSLETLAQRIAGLTDNGNYDSASFILPLYSEYVFPALTEKGSLIVELDSSFDHRYVKFYPHPEQGEDKYYVYYGDMDADGNRQGFGWILSNYDYDGSRALYFYKSGWENDKANGTFVEYNLWGENYDQYNCYYGNLKDYLYDGDITIIWKNGRTYYATYHDGVPEILGTDPDDGQKIIAYDENSEYWLKMPESSVNNPVGVEKM